MDFQAFSIVALAAAIMALLIPMSIIRGSYRMQEAAEAWRKLAERHRLRYDPGPKWYKASVSGTLAGREFRLQRSGGNKNHAVFMEVELAGDLPPGLEMHPVNEAAQVMATAVGIPTSALGGEDPAATLEERLTVTASDPEDVDAYLTAPRTRAASELADLGGVLEKHRLKLKVNKVADNLEELDGALHKLAHLAPAFERRSSARARRGSGTAGGR